jgi:hypothetical protein
LWLLRFLADHPTHYHDKEGFLCHWFLGKVHFENGQVSICQFIHPCFLMLHLLKQCDGHHELHDKDEVGQYKIFQVIQSINNFLSWKVQETNNEKEKAMVF